MKKLSILAILLLTGCQSAPDFKYCDTYAKVGAGYIFDQPKVYWNGGNSHTSPISARFEAGCEYENITYGLSHHSQWLEGAPINNNDEPHKSEFFIDWKFID